MRRDEAQCAALPRISVVIPTYNYARFLPQAIESVLAQTVAPLEILVADDGSTDDTAAVAARYENRIRYFRFSHRGVYALRTRMLEELRGEWWVNLDADNWLATDFLERMGEAIVAHGRDERFAFAYPDMDLFGDSSRRVERPEFDAQRLKLGNYLDMNSLIRVDVTRQFGFDPAFNSGQGDYDFFLTLVENGYWGKRVPTALLHYRMHGDSITQTSFRRMRQRDITRRMLIKHRSFFTKEEAQAARASADNRTLVALIGSRTPFAGLGRRLSNGALFARVGWRHAEFRKQIAYTLCPQQFFTREQPAADVFYLFRDTSERRNLVRQVLGEEGTGLEGGQLFGFEDMWKAGISVECNLRFPRVGSVQQTIQDWKEQNYAPRKGVGLGDVCSVRAHLGQMNRARVVVATSDNTGLPAIRLKAQGRLKAPLVYVSIGLPERMQAVEGLSPARAERYRLRLTRVDRFVTYGWAEAEWLKRWLGDDVHVWFVPFGVDVDKWQPQEEAHRKVDVLSIGADSMRDFRLLVDYARQHPQVGVELVVGKDVAAGLGPLPPNVEIQVQIPLEEVKKAIASARVVVLPVKENTYSGATTTLLQCMAMGKAVAVSQVGAIREGYGFEDGVNLRWMVPGSTESLVAVVDELLADEAQRLRLGMAARRHVAAHLGWDRYVAHMESCLAKWLEEEKVE